MLIEQHCRAIDPVFADQQPPGQPRWERMQGVAGRGLFGLRSPVLRESQDERHQSRAPLGSRAQFISRQADGAAADLDMHARGGRDMSDRGQQSRGAFAPYRYGLDRPSVRHHRHDRDGGIARKVDRGDRGVRFGQNLAAQQRDFSQKRR
jgi:hypothetical protein